MGIRRPEEGRNQGISPSLSMLPGTSLAEALPSLGGSNSHWKATPSVILGSSGQLQCLALVTPAPIVPPPLNWQQLLAVANLWVVSPSPASCLSSSAIYVAKSQDEITPVQKT